MGESKNASVLTILRPIRYHRRNYATLDVETARCVEQMPVFNEEIDPWGRPIHKQMPKATGGSHNNTPKGAAGSSTGKHPLHFTDSATRPDLANKKCNPKGSSVDKISLQAIFDLAS